MRWISSMKSTSRLSQRRQHRRQIAGLLDDRSRRRADRDTELVGDDVGQRGLAEPGRTVQQHVIERLATLPRRGDRDVQILADPLLPDVLVERSRAKSGFVLDVLGDARGGDDAFGHSCQPLISSPQDAAQRLLERARQDAAFNAFSIAFSAAGRW